MRVVLTLAQRMQQVIDEGRVPSARGWGTMAGLSDSIVGKYIRYASKGGGDIGHRTLLALAAAARVSPAWLLAGDGPIDASALPPPRRERYPHRAIAAEAAHMLELAPSAISSVCQIMLQSDTDPPALWWFTRMLSRHTELTDEYAPVIEGRVVSDNDV